MHVNNYAFIALLSLIEQTSIMGGQVQQLTLLQGSTASIGFWHQVLRGPARGRDVVPGAEYLPGRRGAHDTGPLGRGEGLSRLHCHD